MLILPKTFVSYNPNFGPLFFLAGPIRGGGDWQQKCYLEIAKHFPKFYVANPCRYESSHPLWKHRADGNENHFDRQLTWERHYLELASQSGCIIFYLPEESKTEPHPGPEPYGMDTRGELGEWRGRMMYNETERVVIGAEEGFHGLSQIQRNFDQGLGYRLKFHTSLEETVASAIEVVKNS